MSYQLTGYSPGANGRPGDHQNGRPNGHHSSPSPAAEEVAPVDPALLRQPTQPGPNSGGQGRRRVRGLRRFSRPADTTKHSKLPFFFRLHGSILPSLVTPIIFIAAWATVITVINERVHRIAVDSLLLTVLGFVVGLSLSFRSSTAYERYAEGRKFWAQLILHSRNLARITWIHTSERKGEELRRNDILDKVSAINLILGFCQAVKHKLRHEIEYDYKDLKPLICHLDTLAKSASKNDKPAADHNHSIRNRSKPKIWGEKLGLPFCESNPRKSVKAARGRGADHGNLPLEIMNHLSSYYEHCIAIETLKSPCWQSQVSSSIMLMTDAYGGCERVLTTPLPLAYNIAISQITWLYVLVLPFQLCAKLQWAAIPGTIVAAYIILGIAAIGREIENPFGRDVNDLDLDQLCRSLKEDLYDITGSPSPKAQKWLSASDNIPLWPSNLGYYANWKASPEKDIFKALRERANYPVEDEEDSSERVEGEDGDV